YLSFIGYELFLFLIPYVSKKTNFTMALFAGNFVLTIVYLTICILSFGFFSFEQLRSLEFPVLDFLSYLQLPFVERVENFLFALLLIKVLITSILYFWVAEITLKRMVPK